MEVYKNKYGMCINVHLATNAPIPPDLKIKPMIMHDYLKTTLISADPSVISCGYSNLRCLLK